MVYPLSQKEPPINNDADVLESHFGRKAEKSGTVCRESFAGELEELDEILNNISPVFNDERETTVNVESGAPLRLLREPLGVCFEQCAIGPSVG